MEKRLVFGLTALGMSAFIVVVTVLLTVLYIDYNSHIREHHSKPVTNHVPLEGHRTCSCVTTVILNSSSGISQPPSFDPSSSPATTLVNATECPQVTDAKPIVNDSIAPSVVSNFNQFNNTPGSALVLTGNKEFGEACNTTERCIDGVICNFDTKKCVCPHSEQEFLPKLKKCGSKVGGPCGDSIPCAKYSVCQRFRNSSNGLCACPEGIPVLKDERACDVDVGKDCMSSSDCKSNAGIACVNGLCQCEGFSKYVQTGNKCVRLVGSRCDTRSRYNRPQGMKGSECAENSSCEKNNRYKYGSHEGVCKCVSGFEVSSNYTCVPY